NGEAAEPDGALRRDIGLCKADLIGGGVDSSRRCQLAENNCANGGQYFQRGATKRGGIPHSRNETSTQKDGNRDSATYGRTQKLRAAPKAVAEFSVTSRTVGSYCRANMWQYHGLCV